MINPLHLSRSTKGFSSWTIYHFKIYLQVSYAHKRMTEAQPVQTRPAKVLRCPFGRGNSLKSGKHRERAQWNFLNGAGGFSSPAGSWTWPVCGTSS